jgi:hypothetical protein
LIFGAFRGRLRDYEINISGFEERSLMGEPDEVPNQIYHRIEDQLLIFVQSIRFLKSFDNSRTKTEIEN